MDQELLSAVVGIVIATVFRYAPVLKDSYEALDTTTKQLIMLATMAVVTVGVFGVGCAGIVSTGIACTQDGAVQLLRVFVAMVVGNQAAAAVAPKLASTQRAASARRAASESK